MLDVEKLTSFDPCDFRKNEKIKHQDVINLVRELGGHYTAAAGKGSHSKCTLSSFGCVDTFILKGEEIVFADFDRLENQDSAKDPQKAPASSMMTLTNESYLKSYNIRQFCGKLIALGFTPRTVKIKK